MTLLDHVAALVFLIVSKRHGLLAPGIPLPRKQRHSSIPWTDVRGNARTAALVSPSGLLKSLGVASGALLIDAETISEMEVATFRERAQAALFQKAQRGALVRRVAIGYVKGADDRIEKDPDARMRATIDLFQPNQPQDSGRCDAENIAHFADRHFVAGLPLSFTVDRNRMMAAQGADRLGAG